MKTLYVVNASKVLSDVEVQATVEPIQAQIDRDFMPVWKDRVREAAIKVAFARMQDIPQLPEDCWPVFLNRHSNDDGALGWHDDDSSQNIHKFGRIFVGDCLLLGLNWQVTLSHEVLELVLDPNIQRVYRMANGELAAFEACDAVESDDQAYKIGEFLASNFVLPAYFSKNLPGPFDFCKKLKDRCPGLTPGGYMSETKGGRWTQVSMDRGNLMGRRAAMQGHRRQIRATTPEFVIEEDVA
jgi:hypothetical protein